MSVIPCKEAILCPGSDFPITNYSAEGPEQQPSFVSLHFPDSWDKFGCLSLCYSEVSQNAADLCALAQEAACAPPPPDSNSFCSVATTCTCVFNGSEFFYTTPAGTFCAATQEAADALAHAYACDHCGAPTTSVQLLSVDSCTCVDQPYSSNVGFTGARPTTWLITAGALPTGLGLNAATGQIIGTPPNNGTYVFSVRAFLADGNYGQKTFSISVLEITTAVITPFVLGVPYSFQMAAAGGTGNYAWKVSAGTLPTGLTMSSTGLITGTPTAAGSASIQFQIIDTACEAINKSFFTPIVATTSSSLTTVRTRRGYSEYVGSTGDLYKKVTWTGYARQTAQVRPSPSQGVAAAYCAGAQYTYSGASEIDVFGNFISSHRKDLTVACVTSPEFPCRDIFGDPLVNVSALLGYCWPPDPQSCSVCSEAPADWSFKRNDATHSSTDFPYNIVNANRFPAITPTTYGITRDSGSAPAWNSFYLGNFFIPPVPGNPINFPTSVLNSVQAYYVNLFVNINYLATLSEPFTEADQIAGQLQYTSNGRTSENRPNSLSWTSDYIANIQSRLTSANFTLNLSNLVDGESYTVRYEFWRNDGVKTQVSAVFVATGPTHSINGVLPTPAAGQTITLKNASIAFTP